VSFLPHLPSKKGSVLKPYCFRYCMWCNYCFWLERPSPIGSL